VIFNAKNDVLNFPWCSVCIATKAATDSDSNTATYSISKSAINSSQNCQCHASQFRSKRPFQK